jgi:hypothetical protein
MKQGYDNIPPRYKAQLCARGFSQVYELDFEETNVKSLSLRRLELLSESNSNEDENSSDGCRHERLVCRVKKEYIRALTVTSSMEQGDG